MLTKLQSVTFVPGVPGVEARAAYEVCTGGPPSTSPEGGHWEKTCGYDLLPAYVVAGPAPGVYPPDPGPFPYVLYVSVYTCKSVWVPD